MSEAQLLNDIKAIVSNHIQNYTIDVVSRKQTKATTLDTTIAVVFQDNSITEPLLKELIDYTVQNEYNNITLETKKDLNKLDFEYIIIQAEIFY